MQASQRSTICRMASPPLLPPPSLTPQDVEHLKTVAILHYLAAALFALTGCLSILHLGLGIAILTGVMPMQPSEREGAAFTGTIFTAVGLIWMVGWWMMAVVIALGGRNLQLRRSWPFAMIVAVLLAMHAPLGTLLGVFTIVILVRPNVKAVFLTKQTPNPIVAGGS